VLKRSDLFSNIRKKKTKEEGERRTLFQVQDVCANVIGSHL
jgi:hypothetical protein